MPGRVRVVALTYGEDSTPDLFGDVMTFEPGSLYVTGPVTMLREHAPRDPNGAAGVARPEEITVDAAGRVLVDGRTIATPAGALSDVELEAGARPDVSVGVHLDDYVTEPLGGVHPVFGWPLERVRVLSAELVEFTQTVAGRMPSARVLAYTPDPQETP